MVVARVGVAAVAVLAARRQGLLVVALDRQHPALLEERPDLVGVGAEAAEVAQAVERFGAAARGVVEERCERVGVVVDAAEDGDLRVGAFDRRRVLARGAVAAHLGPALVGAEGAPVAARRAAELGQRHELLAPGRHAAVGGELGALGGAARLGVVVFRRALAHVLQLTP